MPRAESASQQTVAVRPRLAVTGLSVGYHGIPVVRDVDLHVGAGEIVALLGSNGAGKTTTLAAIAGLLRPLEGTVELDGESIGGVPAQQLARRGVALVPEDRALFHELTTAENLRVAARRHSGSDVDVLDLLPELRKCLPRRAGLLSGGEQQMLAVGRALVSGPRLLVVDEMSLGLAPVVVERLLPVLRTVAARLGAAVLIVEQHVSLALDVAERAYVMAHGRVVVEGRTRELRSRRDLLMACYLGDLDAAARLASLAGSSTTDHRSTSDTSFTNKEK